MAGKPKRNQKSKRSGSYSSASCGKVGGSWGQVGLSGGHVEAALGYAIPCWSYMSDFVRPCCWFCIQKCLPPSRTKIIRYYKWVSASYVGSIWGSNPAILWLCWLCWHHLGINLGHLWAHDDAMLVQFGGYNSGIAKNHPKLYLENALPHGPRGVTE